MLKIFTKISFHSYREKFKEVVNENNSVINTHIHNPMREREREVRKTKHKKKDDLLLVISYFDDDVAY